MSDFIGNEKSVFIENVVDETVAHMNKHLNVHMGALLSRIASIGEELETAAKQANDSATALKSAMRNLHKARVETNSVVLFAQDNMMLTGDPAHKLMLSELYKLYLTFTVEDGAHPETKQTFRKTLELCGYNFEIGAKNKRYFKGVKLIEDEWED